MREGATFSVLAAGVDARSSFFLDSRTDASVGDPRWSMALCGLVFVDELRESGYSLPPLTAHCTTRRPPPPPHTHFSKHATQGGLARDVEWSFSMTWANTK